MDFQINVIGNLSINQYLFMLNFIDLLALQVVRIVDKLVKLFSGFRFIALKLKG